MLIYAKIIVHKLFSLKKDFNLSQSSKNSRPLLNVATFNNNYFKQKITSMYCLFKDFIYGDIPCFGPSTSF